MESQKYIAEYLGNAEVSNFFNKSAVPWIVKEVHRLGHHEQVTVQLSDGFLLVENPLAFRTVFRHSVNHIHHFSQTVADPCCFLYFVRQRSALPAHSASNTLYLYRMRDKDMVSVLFSTIREHSRRVPAHQSRSISDASAINLQQLRRFVESSSVDQQLHQLTSCSSDTTLTSKTASAVRLNWDDAHRHSHFEVQYVCKIKTSHRKGPVSFIDEAVQHFLITHHQSNADSSCPDQGGGTSTGDARSSDSSAISSPAYPASLHTVSSFVTPASSNPAPPTTVSSLVTSTSSNPALFASSFVSPIVPTPVSSTSTATTTSSPLTQSIVFSSAVVEMPPHAAIRREGSGDSAAQGDVTATSFVDNNDVIVCSTADPETEIAEEATEERLGDESSDQKLSKSVPIPIGRMMHSSEHNVVNALTRGNQLSPLPESVSETAAEILALMESGQEGLATTTSTTKSATVPEKSSQSQASGDHTRSESGQSFLKSVESSESCPPIRSSSNLMNILYIADTELCLISTAEKTLRLKTQLSDITQVAQGVKCKEYFGYICRDSSSMRCVSTDSLNSNNSDTCTAPPVANRSNYNYAGYIFRCQNNRISEEVAQLLKQVIHNAHEVSRRQRHKRLSDSTACQLCPSDWFNKLCVHIEGLTSESLLHAIWRAVETLPPADCHQLKLKMSGADLDQLDRQAELLMSLIRLMCDEKQTRHRHTTANSHSVDKSDDLMFDMSSSISRAKKTLTSRFEQVWRHGWSRDEPLESATPKPPRRRTMTRSCSLTSDSDVPRDAPNAAVSAATVSSDNGAGLDRDCTASDQQPRRRSSTFSGMCSVDVSKSSASPSQVVKTSSAASETQPLSSHGSLMTMWGCKPPALPEPVCDHEPCMMCYGSFKRIGPSTPSKSAVPDSKTPFSSGRSSLDPYSWRQSILWRVKSPGNSPSSAQSTFGEQVTQVVSPRSADDAQHMWRRLITQQILLNRMERENAKVLERCSRDGFGSNRSISGGGERIQYHQLPDCPQDTADRWEQVLRQLEERSDEVDFSWEQLNALVLEGVPLSRRAEIWQILVSRHCERHSFSGPPKDRVPNYHAPYQQLISELTSFQREILTDLGRTFPHHPYFRSPFGAGQLEMFNVLKAISLLDTELGYCQGLGFIAGILLFHMCEKEAYNVMKHVLFGLDLRKQFMPDMVAMHIQMYQLSRLLHDLQRDLYEHLEKHEVSPMLYAAPWFMTMFASQFPIGFSSRVFDLVLLCGVEALFRVSIALLLEHSQQLLSLSGLEEIMEYVKGTMCRPSMQTARAVFARASRQDISQQLLTYEVEYHVLQEEVIGSPSADNEVNRLSAINQGLKRQMMDLLQQLQIARDNEQMISAQNKHLEQRLRATEHRFEQLVNMCQSLLQSPDVDHELLTKQLRPFLDSVAAESHSAAKRGHSLRSCSAHDLTISSARNRGGSPTVVLRATGSFDMSRSASSDYLSQYGDSGGAAKQTASDNSLQQSSQNTPSAPIKVSLPTIKLDES